MPAGIMNSMIESLLLLVTLAQPLWAFPFGAPVSSCKSLEPEHTSPTACRRNCPFKLTVIEIDNKNVSNPTAYRCGAVHKIRLQSTGDAIKGFAVQARLPTPEFDERAPFVGQFVKGGPDWKLWTCDTPSATHRSNSDKTFVDLTWKAPDSPTSRSVVFWYTAVNSFAEYYVRLKGPQLGPSCPNIERATNAPVVRPSPLVCTSKLRGQTLQVNCSSAITSAACRIDAQPPSLCTFPFSKDVSHLPPGNHTLVITTPDNSVSTVVGFAIQATLSLSCKGITDDFSFTVNCNSSVPLRTVLCAVDDFPPRACTLPFKRPINPTSPSRSVSVFATGMNGVGATVTVDLVRLTLQCSTQVDRGLTVTVTCTSNSRIATTQCALDDELANPCIIPYTKDISELPPGSHRILVTAVTTNGSSASTTASFNVPVSGAMTLKCEGEVTDSYLTVICESPNEITNLQCSLDQSDSEPCTLPYTTDVSMLSPGQHTFSATVIGPNGVPASSTVRFATSAPHEETTINNSFNDACSSVLLSNSVASSECEEGCPYTLSFIQVNGRAVSNLFTYQCTANYTVSLVSKEDPFTAIVVQARSSSAFFDTEAPLIGQFISTSNGDIGNCGAGVALKTSSVPTKNLQLTWEAPKTMASDVTFWYSVKTTNKIFLQLRGPSLSPNLRSCTAQLRNP